MESVFYFTRENGSFSIPKDERHHMQVLRMKLPSEVHFTDGSGSLYKGSVDKDYTITDIEEICSQNTEHINVIFGVCEKSRMKLILEKCTELGVKSFQPLITERSGEYPFSAHKAEAVIKAAVKQSRRYFMPEYNTQAELISLDDCFFKNAVFGSIDETEEENLFENIENIFIGPPSGFTEHEENYLKKRGVKPVHMKTGILRTETFAIAALSIAHYMRR